MIRHSSAETGCTESLELLTSTMSFSALVDLISASVTGFFLVARTIATVLCYALMVYVVVVIQDYKGLIRDCLLAGGAMMVSESLSRFCQTVFSAYERPQYTVLTNLIGGALKILGIGVIIAIRRMTVFSFVMMIGVTSLNSDTVSLIDPSFREQTAIKVGSQPMDMAFRGSELFVACQGDGSVHVIDIPGRQHKSSFKAGTGCESLGFF